MYDPTVGRFITLDPIGFNGKDANTYRYCGNSPTNATDPTGLESWNVQGEAVSPYVKFIIAKGGWTWIPFSDRIVSPVNNQWITHQWFKPTEPSKIGIGRTGAYSIVVCSGDFDCNTGTGDCDYGRVRVYISNLPAGDYEVTLSLNVIVSANAGGYAAVTIRDGNGKSIIKPVFVGRGNNYKQYDSKLITITISVHVATDNADTLVLDYDPKVATPYGGRSQTYAKAKAHIGVVKIQKK